MGYNAIDLIDKCMSIEVKKRKILKTIADSDDISARLRIVIKALLKDINRVMDYYDNIKKELCEIEELSDIEFRTYDKISFLVNEYNNKIEMLNMKKNSPKEFLQFFLELTIDKHTLFVDIQGRLYNNMKANDKAYKILSQIISFSTYEIRVIKKTME